MSGIDALLARLPQWTLVAGKGGVGKTTCAAALALRAAARAERTLLLSTDPAGSLGDALGTPVAGEPGPVADAPGLDACQLDAPAARRTFLERWRDVLITIVDRGTYLERDDIAGLVDAALPGADEAMAVLTLADLADESAYVRVIVDTAPTGHTLRLLALPETLRALIDLLDRMQEKHRFMVSALTHRYRADAADAFLAMMRARIARLRALLTRPARTAALLVTRPEPVVVAETARYGEALREMGITLGALVVNAVPGGGDGDVHHELTALRRALPDVPRFIVPWMEALPEGRGRSMRWGDALSAETTAAPRRARRARAATRAAAGTARLELRPVTLVGGKGGVGKTTVSCALALDAARTGSRVLLVSTDPAPSIADALAQPVGDEERVIDGAWGLVARQIDATRAFARWREEYQTRVDAAFAALLGPGVDAAHDRAVARDLLALAPPGIDELYALVWLGDALAQARYDRIVIDPAPTGHLLRLLEMPALALDWSHRLLRLMLKYRELAGGGEMPADLLAFSRRTRAVGELLRDPARSSLIAVALDEPLVRSESERVVSRVRALGMEVQALVWNRARRDPRPLSLGSAAPQFVASDERPPPVGVERLVAWRAQWRTLAVDGD